MGFLTTHVLDTASGCPARAMKVEFYRIEGDNARLLKTLQTNEDGRADEPVLSERDFVCGIYELRFFAGDYLRDRHGELPDPLFLDVIPVRFGMADETSHYHVPLLVSPFGYSTYRGS